MLREAIGKPLDHDPHFSWRGEAVTRIENLSDIAFALALGMIVAGGFEAPRTYADMVRFMLFMVPAAAGFAVLLGIWTAHYTFFRRYGVADRTIILLNAVLIFVVLGMAYPLRFTFDSLFAWIVALATGDLSRFEELGVMDMVTSGRIIAIFALIYAASHALVALMYRHALSRRALLALDAPELAATRAAHLRYWLAAALSLGVAALGWFSTLGGFSGAFLALTGLCGSIAKRVHRPPPVAPANPAA